MRYTKVSESAFSELQVNAGILLSNFDLNAAGNGYAGFVDSDIIGATTGGINPVCNATYSDYAEDVDNVPNNTKEFKNIDGYDCSISTTLLSMTANGIKLSVGAADIQDAFSSGDATGKKIIPRMKLQSADFKDLWWVGDMANGGFLAIRIINALSTGGFSLQTTKNGKGGISVTISGHVSITNPDAVPMEFYVIDPLEGTIPVEGIGVTPASTTLDIGDELQLQVNIIPPTATNKNLTFSNSGQDQIATVDQNGLVKATGSGLVMITVTAGDSTYGTFSDTCSVYVNAEE